MRIISKYDKYAEKLENITQLILAKQNKMYIILKFNLSSH